MILQFAVYDYDYPFIRHLHIYIYIYIIHLHIQYTYTYTLYIYIIHTHIEREPATSFSSVAHLALRVITRPALRTRLVVVFLVYLDLRLPELDVNRRHTWRKRDYRQFYNSRVEVSVKMYGSIDV